MFPYRASFPILFVPAAIGRSSSSSTTASRAAVTVGPPCIFAPFDTIVMPLAPLSLLPIASVIIKLGKFSRNSSLHVCENKTALDDTANNDDTSGASLAATISFHASSSGRAIASPVIIIKLAFSEAIVFQTPLASNFSRSTVELPTKLCPITLHCDAPCMSGGSGYVTIENPVFPFGIKSVGCDTFSPLRISIPPPSAIKTSSCLQTTPFGIPVVPPVNKMY